VSVLLLKVVFLEYEARVERKRDLTLLLSCRRHQVQSVLTSAGCSDVLAEDQLACLRNATAASILAEQTKVKSFGGFPYAPTVDGLMISDLPSKLYSASNFRRVPLIVGTNLDEVGPSSFLSLLMFAFTTLSASRRMMRVP
jgi:hypothetical protein